MHPNRLATAFTLGLFAVVLAFGSGCSREAKKARHLERGNRYFQAEQYSKAELEYLNVLRLDNANGVALRQLAFTFFQQGRYPQSFFFLEKAKKSDPNNVEIRSKLAFSHALARDLSKARAEALFVLSQQPTHDEAWIVVADTTSTNQIAETKQLLDKHRPAAEKQLGFQVASGILHVRANQFTDAELSFKEAVRLNPRSPHAHSALGNFYVRQRKPELAEPEMKAASDSAPIRSVLSMTYADFLVKRGRVEEGKKLLQALKQKAPDFVLFTARLADIAFAQNDYDACAALLKDVLSKDPGNFEAQLLNGRLKIVRNDAGGAVSDFQRLTAAFPKVPQAHYHLAMAHLANKDVAAASASLSQALALDPDYAEAVLAQADLTIRKRDYPAAITSLSEFLKKEPHVIPAQLLLANAHRAAGQFPQARAIYQKLSSAFPQSPELPLLLGTIYLQEAKTNEARQQFERTLTVSSNHLVALEQLVDLDLSAKNPAAAFQRIQPRLTATNVPMHLLLAKIRIAEKKTNEAELALRKVIELAPDTRNAYMMLSEIYISGKRHREALGELQTVIAKNPKDVGALMLTGMIHDAMKDYSEARDAYEKILAVNPRFVPALNNLAYIYSEHLNNLPRAFDLAKQASDLQPNDPAAADTLGWILFKRGDFSRALSLLQQSAEALPTIGEVQFHLGMVHYALAQPEPARLAFERSLAQNEDFLGKPEAQQRLAFLKNSSRTVVELEKLQAERPTDTLVLVRLAEAYERSGSADKATRTYENALKQNPENVTAMLKLAGLYSQDPRTSQKAIELAKKARNLAPNDARAAHALGKLVYRSGDHRWAASLLEESLREFSNDAQLLYDVGQAYYSVGRLSDAERAMQKALQEAGQSAWAANPRSFLEIASFCSRSNLATADSRRVDEVLKRDPEHLPALFADALIKEQRGDLSTARAAFEAIQRKFPAFIPVHKHLASLLAHEADVTKAYEHAVKAREAFPNDPEVAKSLGIISFKRKDFRRSADLLAESSRARASDAEIFYFLGKAKLELKQPGEAVVALRQAVTLNPNANFADDAKQTIAKTETKKL